MVKTEGLQRFAENQQEFIDAWSKEVDHLIGFYPLNEDYERFKELKAELKGMIERKAKTLKF
jgi:hypothetical protein